jgi:hypothetical protein
MNRRPAQHAGIHRSAIALDSRDATISELRQESTIRLVYGVI